MGVRPILGDYREGSIGWLRAKERTLYQAPGGIPKMWDAPDGVQRIEFSSIYLYNKSGSSVE
jgi:hypothetical protein